MSENTLDKVYCPRSHHGQRSELKKKSQIPPKVINAVLASKLSHLIGLQCGWLLLSDH